MLEIFNNLFFSVAEQMGVILKIQHSQLILKKEWILVVHYLIKMES